MTRLRIRKTVKPDEPQVKNPETKAQKVQNTRKGTKRKTFESGNEAKEVPDTETVKQRPGRNNQNLKLKNVGDLDKSRQRRTLKNMFPAMNGPKSQSPPGTHNTEVQATESHCSSPAMPSSKVNSPAKKRSKLSLKGAKDSGKTQPSVQKLMFSKGEGQSVEKNENKESEADNKENLIEILKPPCVAALHNLGNTCFLNSVLQVLRYTPGFKSSIADLAREIKITQKEKQIVANLLSDPVMKSEEILTWRLITSLHDAFRKMQVAEDRYKKGQTQYIATRPYDLMDTLEKLNPMFEGNYQQDAHELLRCLLAYIQDASKEINNYRSKHRIEEEEEEEEEGEDAKNRTENETETKDKLSDQTEAKESEPGDSETVKADINESESTGNENETRKNEAIASDSWILKPEQQTAESASFVTIEILPNTEPTASEGNENESVQMETNTIVQDEAYIKENISFSSDTETLQNNSSKMEFEQFSGEECEVVLLTEESQSSIDSAVQNRALCKSAFVLAEKITLEQGDFKENFTMVVQRENTFLNPDGGCDMSSIKDRELKEIDRNVESKALLNSAKFSPRENMFDKFCKLGTMTSQEQLDGACDPEVKDTADHRTERSRLSRKIKKSNKDNVPEKTSTGRTRSRSNPKINDLGRNYSNKQDNGNVSEKENVYDKVKGDKKVGGKSLKTKSQSSSTKVVMAGKNPGYDIASFFKKKSVVCLERCDPQNHCIKASKQEVKVEVKGEVDEEESKKAEEAETIVKSTECSPEKIKGDVCEEGDKESSTEVIKGQDGGRIGAVKTEAGCFDNSDQERKSPALKTEVIKEETQEDADGTMAMEGDREERVGSLENDKDGEKVSESERMSAEKEKPVQKTPSKCRRVGLSKHRFSQARVHLTKITDPTSEKVQEDEGIKMCNLATAEDKILNEGNQVKTELTGDLTEQKTELTNDSIEEKPELTNDSTEEKPELMDDLTEEKPELTNDLAKEKPELMNDSAKEKPELMDDSTEENTELTTDSAKEKPELMNDSAKEKPELKINSTEEIPELKTGSTEEKSDLTKGSTEENTELTNDSAKETPELPNGSTEKKPEFMNGLPEEKPGLMNGSTEEKTELITDSIKEETEEKMELTNDSTEEKTELTNNDSPKASQKCSTNDTVGENKESVKPVCEEKVGNNVAAVETKVKATLPDTGEIASPNTTLKNEARSKKSVVRIKKCSIGSFFRRPPQKLEDVKWVTTSVSDCVETLFQGNMALRTKCLVCERYTERKEAYQDISVPVKKAKPQSISTTTQGGYLSDNEEEESSDPSSWIFSSLDEVECLRDDNKYFCDNCLCLNEAQRSMHYVSTPDLLTLHLKRFAALSGYFGGFTKMSDYVPTPLNLPCIQDECRQKCTDPGHGYELYGMVTHTGFSLSSGHYVAYVKAPGTKMENPQTSSASNEKQGNANGNFHQDIPPSSPMTAGSEIGNKLKDEVNDSKSDPSLDEVPTITKNTSVALSNDNKGKSIDNRHSEVENSAEQTTEISTAVWYECDDEIVTEMTQSSFEEVLAQGSASTPYLLFYRRVGLVDNLQS